MKTATNIYIFNLALADALVTTTMPFQSTDYLLNSWPFGEVVCKVFISIDYYNMFTSIFTLTMMSVDRYVAVCHPVKALDFRTPINAKMINVCIWMLSSAAGIPALLLGGTQTNNGENARRHTHSHEARTQKNACAWIHTRTHFRREHHENLMHSLSWFILCLCLSESKCRSAHLISEHRGLIHPHFRPIL